MANVRVQRLLYRRPADINPNQRAKGKWIKSSRLVTPCWSASSKSESEFHPPRERAIPERKVHILHFLNMKIIPDAFSARHNLGQIHNLLVEKIWGEYMSSTGTKGGVKGNNIDLLCSLFFHKTTLFWKVSIKNKKNT